MNTKEIAELRRRWAPDKNCVGRIFGCFVNCQKEIISRFSVSAALMAQGEAEKYLSLFKKTLSGAPDRNLLSLSFTTAQVADSDEHRMLNALRLSNCEDEEAREALFARMIEVIKSDENYLILLASDTFDVPFRKGDTIRQESETVFRYFLCCVCPVRDGKPELGYFAEDREFRSCTPPQTVSAPDFGFLFPSFDNRRANIYSTLFYTKDASCSHEAFISEVLKTEAPMSAGAQKEAFGDALTESLEEGCSFTVIRSVHEQIRDRIEEYKESGELDPIDFSSRDVAQILRDSGVEDGKVTTFEERCTEAFGKDAPLSPANLIDTRRFEVRTPSVRVTVSSDALEKIDVREVDGRKYLMIPADEGVEINGMTVHAE